MGEQKDEFLSHLAWQCPNIEGYHDWEYFMSEQFLTDCDKGQEDLDYLSQFTLDGKYYFAGKLLLKT